MSDGKEKVWRSGDILVGEVTKISQESELRRRIYLSPRAYVMADITGKDVKITGRGGVACMVLGNKFTQKLASEGVAKAKGRVNEQVIRSILEDAGKRTASVSREHTLLRIEVSPANPDAAVLAALKKDCEKNGWREAMRSGVILAGGSGSRLGTEKSLLSYLWKAANPADCEKSCFG